MACGGGNLIARMSAVNQNIDRTLVCEIALKHFKKYKVEISDAIETTFPFLEILRDRGFITNKIYEDSQDSCRNLVPVQRVVYGVLSEVEKTFDLSLLETLFSDVIMKSYPALNRIYESFKAVIQQGTCQESDEKERKENLNTPKSLEQGTGENYLTWISTNASHYDESSEKELQEANCSRPQMVPEPIDLRKSLTPGKRLCKTIRRRGDSSESSVKNEHPGAWSPELRSDPDEKGKDRHLWAPGHLESEFRAPVFLSTHHSPGAILCIHPLFLCQQSKRVRGRLDNLVTQSPHYDLQRTFAPSTVRRRGDSSESSVKNEHPGAWSPELRSDPDEKGTVNLEKNSTLGKSKGKRNTVDLGNNSILGKRIRKRRLKVNTNESVNFQSEILPVTCGTVKGMLYKNKLKQGAIVKSIQSEDGNWFTPREFEVKGGYEKSSNWKLSVRCGGKTLKRLMEVGFLPNPPRLYNRKKKIPPPGLHRTPQFLLKPLPDVHSKVKEEHTSVRASSQSAQRNSDVCEVCHDGGKLFCCDTCSRSFHEDCHLPPVETKRSPWSCIFCRMKPYLGCQKCHRESEVLTRQMGPEEQLKCEFLLVNVYCHSVMNVFEKIPHDNYRKETSQCVGELMILNDIKKKLNKRSYFKVGMFVRDMRLIFRSHRASYKCSDFVLMKIRLEKEFEKNFKEVFAIWETNEKSS
ncbi:nuclear body protein SP140-like protein [Pteropus alecto]|uniref:nuclear body protein SP140-like protein n=1 Tax=Pteropus alecto TaxID=9402 RepID=UPI000D5317EF|nr:nuclear body protein SP140-like protein [Pteropus alecto]